MAVLMVKAADSVSPDPAMDHLQPKRGDVISTFPTGTTFFGRALEKPENGFILVFADDLSDKEALKFCESGDGDPRDCLYRKYKLDLDKFPPADRIYTNAADVLAAKVLKEPLILFSRG